MDYISRARLGGKARAKALTPKQRSESARMAVAARWEKAGKAKTRTENSAVFHFITWDAKTSVAEPPPSQL